MQAKGYISPNWRPPIYVPMPWAVSLPDPRPKMLIGIIMPSYFPDNKRPEKCSVILHTCESTFRFTRMGINLPKEEVCPMQGAGQLHPVVLKIAFVVQTSQAHVFRCGIDILVSLTLALFVIILFIVILDDGCLLLTGPLGLLSS